MHSLPHASRALTPRPLRRAQTADTCTQALSNAGLWGLDRLDGATNNAYAYAPCAGGVTTHVFVIDTGIYSGHAEFATNRVSATSTCTAGTLGCAAGTTKWADDNGHGTHCSGVAGGRNTGVAKRVVFHAVKVLAASGSGSVSAVAAGVKWVQDAVAANPTTLRPAVVSMSLGGGISPTIDTAVAALVASGVPVVVAAGNSAADACTSSPADVAGAITVAASDSASASAYFTNYGSCVDLYAPGVNVYSSVNAAGAYATWSGTSMATPHVAGVVAQMLSVKPCLKPPQVASLLLSSAIAGIVAGAPAGTPNKFVNAPAAVAAAAAAVCV